MESHWPVHRRGSAPDIDPHQIGHLYSDPDLHTLADQFSDPVGHTDYDTVSVTDMDLAGERHYLKISGLIYEFF